MKQLKMSVLHSQIDNVFLAYSYLLTWSGFRRSCFAFCESLYRNHKDNPQLTEKSNIFINEAKQELSMTPAPEIYTSTDKASAPKLKLHIS